MQFCIQFNFTAIPTLLLKPNTSTSNVERIRNKRREERLQRDFIEDTLKNSKAVSSSATETQQSLEEKCQLLLKEHESLQNAFVEQERKIREIKERNGFYKKKI